MVQAAGNEAPGSEAFQPASFAFDPESEAEVARHIAKYPPGRQASAVLPLLWIVQAADAPRDRQRLGAAGGDGYGGATPQHGADPRL